LAGLEDRGRRQLPDLADLPHDLGGVWLEQRRRGVDWETPEWQEANRRVDRLWRRSRWIDRFGTRAD
jgi:hypothetical protein